MSGYSKDLWGGIVNAPSAPAQGEKIIRAQVNSAELGRLLEHWNKMHAEKPELRGLTASARTEGAAPALELLLCQGGEKPFVVLTVSSSPAFPRTSAVWPYSLWWEEELRTFGGVEFAGTIPERDASWRPL